MTHETTPEVEVEVVEEHIAAEVEVEVVDEYFPALRDVRAVYIKEVTSLLDAGRGRLARRFRCVHPALKHSFRLMRGRGVQLYVQGEYPHQLYFPGEPCKVLMLHAVLLYRGLDGEYCFFDSNFAIAPTPEVKAVVHRSGPAPLHWREHDQYGVQGVGVNSCQYYCLAFMSFAVQHRTTPTARLIGEFAASMRPQGDEKAVRISQEIFDEAGIVRDFESAGTPLHVSCPPASTTSRRQARSRRPAARRPVVSRYLRGLTRAQVRSLLASVSVTVVLPR